MHAAKLSRIPRHRIPSPSLCRPLLLHCANTHGGMGRTRTGLDGTGWVCLGISMSDTFGHTLRKEKGERAEEVP